MGLAAFNRMRKQQAELKAKEFKKEVKKEEDKKSKKR